MIASIDLPWPNRLLHPNARPHRLAKARAAKKARADASWLAKAAKIQPIEADRLAVTAIFFPPDARARDIDGMLASIKPALDGIADAIGIDDSRWDIAMRREDPRKHGAVRIEIEVTA